MRQHNVLGGERWRPLFVCLFVRVTSIGIPGLYKVYIGVQELCGGCCCEQIGGTYGKDTLLQRPAS